MINDNRRKLVAKERIWRALSFKDDTTPNDLPKILVKYTLTEQEKKQIGTDLLPRVSRPGIASNALDIAYWHTKLARITGYLGISNTPSSLDGETRDFSYYRKKTEEAYKSIAKSPTHYGFTRNGIQQRMGEISGELETIAKGYLGELK